MGWVSNVYNQVTGQSDGTRNSPFGVLDPTQAASHELDNFSVILGQPNSKQGRNAFGFGSSGPTLNTQIAQQQQNDTTSAYRAAAPNLDHTTNSEVDYLLRNSDPSAAAEILAQAKQGNGIYAVRKIDENQRKLIQMRPGRAQLSDRYSLFSSGQSADNRFF